MNQRTCRDRICESGIPLTHFNALPESDISIGCKWFGSQSETGKHSFPLLLQSHE